MLRSGGSLLVWAAHSFCMSVSFHNPSTERDCQASLQLQQSIRACHPAITTERWGPNIRIPLAPVITPGSLASQPAPCLGPKEIIKWRIKNRLHCWLPLGYAEVSTLHWYTTWLMLLFIFCLFMFSPKIEFCFCFFPSSLQKGLKL